MRPLHLFSQNNLVKSGSPPPLCGVCADTSICDLSTASKVYQIQAFLSIKALLDAKTEIHYRKNDMEGEMKEQDATDTVDLKQQADSHDVMTHLTWHAPGRPFRHRGKEFYKNVLIILLPVIIILFLLKEVFLILVVIAFVFFVYAISTVPPHDFTYRITSEGIFIEDHFFIWEELYDFYFRRVENSDVVHLRTKAFFPGELTMTLGPVEKEKVKSALLPYLPFREYVKPTFMEKAGDWLSHTFPLERPMVK